MAVVRSQAVQPSQPSTCIFCRVVEWYPYGSAVSKARLGDLLGPGGGRYRLGRALAARNGQHLGTQDLDLPIQALLGLSADA